MNPKSEVLIIGSGLAGLTAALILGKAGFTVNLLTEEDLGEGNSYLAQGGIVYKNPQGDPQSLEQDIFQAGCKLNYKKAVKLTALQGPQLVEDILLKQLDIPFAREGKKLLLTKEGAHSLPRILFCKDFTGKAIMDKLIQEVSKLESVKIYPQHLAIDLLTSHHHSTRLEFKYHLENQCLGAYVLDKKNKVVLPFLAEYTLLATGGLGQIFLHSTNSLSSIGSGLSMAYRAGCRLLNLEYIQFHPTSLFHLAPRKFLISEAVRGEGAFLVNHQGNPFMQEYHPQKDLAPRDIVTRAIWEEMLKHNQEHVFLNISRVKNFPERFPTIYQQCVQEGIQIQKELIPVVPAAHYFCGGILVNHQGQTTLKRLYAAGECSCTGLHGANRLASTSLLEALIWGYRSARSIQKALQGKTKLRKALLASIPDWEYPQTPEPTDPALLKQDWSTIKHTMWNYVGIIRSKARLKRAFEELQLLNKRLHDFYRETELSADLVKLYHACQSAYIITRAALKNKTSQGCHFRKD